MKKKLDLNILENADMKTLEALSYKYRAVDDAEAEKIFRRITNDTEDYYEETQEHKVEVYHRPMWSKAWSAAATLAIAAVTVTGGVYFNSQLNDRGTIEGNNASDAVSYDDENTYAPITITADYDGPILGVENWHLDIDKHLEYDNTWSYSFINEDTGFEFAYSECSEGKPIAYLADIDNDGADELICNRILAVVGGKPNDHAIVFKLRDGVIEAANFYDHYEAFSDAHDLDISSYVDFSDEYSPDLNKLLLKSRYFDKDYELELEDYTFGPAYMYPIYANFYFGCIFGIKNWHIYTESLSSDTENTYFINEDTNEIFVEYTGYKDKTSAFFTDLEDDNRLELICNYQYGEAQENMNNHVKIYRYNNGVIECGDFLSDFEEFGKANGIELTSLDDFSEVYDVESNRIILKKQGEDTPYELGIEYFNFKPVVLRTTSETADGTAMKLKRLD
ncbi:hypothetical protein [Ruminococcus flavefaciens]|uniref:hypothetical protein n=1 Tax=Ruminococcus flavefaciens TaxID=1265 RepID=UPI000466D7A8|nr:hypothetical protein [Ruminococcus flavefaciens]